MPGAIFNLLNISTGFIRDQCCQPQVDGAARMAFKSQRFIAWTTRRRVTREAKFSGLQNSCLAFLFSTFQKFDESCLVLMPSKSFANKLVLKSTGFLNKQIEAIAVRENLAQDWNIFKLPALRNGK